MTRNELIHSRDSVSVSSRLIATSEGDTDVLQVAEMVVEGENVGAKPEMERG